MNRRDFALGVAAAPLAAATRAAVVPVAGKHYRELPRAIPPAAPGRIELIEFFGYWCPHCRSLEPALEKWLTKLPGDVAFRRVPVAWRPGQEAFQRLYFALDSLGKTARADIHQQAFDAVQMRDLQAQVPAAVAAFANANGLDAGRLTDAMSGFSVSAKVRQAAAAVSDYGIDSVPTFALQGRYITSPSMVGGHEPVFEVLDALIVQARGGR